ncbi:TonB-dependent receptor [Flavihumibacter rivuli]|uniref:TonB-dependent receptor n=1 Tax=Flavihumibacter rivuli TaxID=2838156 RepID=UPI001BDE8F22|nr:TonB-dependent receptor [Flavihumibacter rivuli]ULQ56355.1 TonB-dependent receptor [Flavihumibacter rivuli]
MSKKLLSLLLLVLVAYLPVLAQTTVKLSGKVINTRNEAVPGATVIIPGTQRKTAADVEGRFSFLLEVGKKYTIQVSSAGYSSKSLEDVEVKAGDDNTVTVVLETKSELGEVVVRTSVKKETTSALINLQRNNTAVSSGIAADLIKRTPDRTTGEVLKRVSGASIQDNKFVIVRGLSDRYNAAFINNAQLPSSEPDRKAFSFDVIPANMIDNIIINKTATPELTGEFAGGLIQVQTKDVPSRNFLSIGAQLGFNTNSAFKDFTSNPRSSTDWLGWDNGNRKLPAGFPATRVEYAGLTTDQQVEKSKLFNDQVYQQQTVTALPIQQYNISYGSAKSLKNDAKLGFIASVVYRNAQLRYDVSRQFNQADGTPIFNFLDNQNRYQTNIGALVNLTYSQKNNKISFKNIFNRFFDDNFFERNGFNTNRNQDINFYSSFLNQRSFYSGQLEGDHQLNWKRIKFRWNAGYSLVTRTQPDLRTQQYVKSSTANEFEIDPDDTRRFFSDLKDHTLTASGAFTVPFELFKQKHNLKFGGSSIVRFRDFNSRIFRYIETPPIESFDKDLASLPFDKIFLTDNIRRGGFVLDEFTNSQDKYYGISAINSGFLLFDNKLSDDIRLVWGARLEFFEQYLNTELDAKEVNLNTETWDFLPSLNLTWSLNTRNNLRFAAFQTVARPEFREIAPFAFFDYEANYGVSGNPDLKRTKILNLDLRYEMYPAAGETFSIGAFYKSFTDPIEFRLDPGSNADRRLYFYQNAGSANTYGAELEIRKNMGFLSKGSQFWKNVTAFGNLTYLFSDVSFPDEVSGQPVNSNRPIQGQSPYLINAGIQYSSEKYLNATILYNRIGPRLALVGNTEFPDIYERPRHLLDFQLSKRILDKKGELKLTFSDILNNPIYLYENVGGSKEFNGNDRMFSSYRPGSTISVGFTYDFDLKK